MNADKKTDWNRIKNFSWWCIGVGVLILFYIGVCLYPICSDDFGYAYIVGSDSRVGNLYDVFLSQSRHYMIWGGRFVAHFLAQSFLIIPKFYFNIANVICYAVCTYAIARTSTKSGVIQLWVLALLSLWVLMPHSGSTMFWLTGSFNYLWSACFLVLFLLCLFSNHRRFRYGAILLGLIAGNSHECLSFGGVIALLLYCVFTSRRDRLFYVAVCAYLVGMLSNVLAPGNMVRMSGINQQHSMSVFVLYGSSFLRMVQSGLLSFSDISLVVARGLWLITMFVCIRGIRKGERGYIMPLCLAVGALATLGLNVVAKTYYSRAYFGFCFLSYFSFLYMLGENFTLRKYKFIYTGFFVFVLILNCIEIPRAYSSITSLRTVYERIQQGTDNQQTIIEAVDGCAGRYVESYGLSGSTLNTQPLKRYYGVSELSILPSAVYLWINRETERLKQMQTHEVVRMMEDWYVMKLREKPVDASANVDFKRDFSQWPDVVKIAGEKLFPPKKLRYGVDVFCFNGEYFVSFKTLQPGGDICIKYPNGESGKIVCKTGAPHDLSVELH